MDSKLTKKRCSLSESNRHIQNRPLQVLLTSISSDSHTWNLVFLQLLLEKQGHTVVNLGCCVPDEEIIEQSNLSDIDLVVVSTVNGHGHIEGNRLIKLFKKDKKVAHIPVVIGGKIGIDGKDNSKHYSNLLKGGFDAVFDDSSDLVTFQNYIKQISPVPRISHLQLQMGER